MKSILIAEDDPKDLELLQLSLQELNLPNPIVAVRDGAEALEYLNGMSELGGQSRLPSVILLDIKMPRVDGISALRQIKADDKLKQIPVVMLTSSREEKDLVLCYDLGASAYVVKPMKFGDFSAAIRALGLFWMVINEPPP